MSCIKKFGYYLNSIWTLFKGVKHPWKLVRLFLYAKHDQPQLLELSKTDLKMWVRGRMDAWSVKEAVLDRFYERFGTKVQSDWTVVDVGAAIGEFTVLAAKEASRGKVFALEPNPQSVAILLQNLKANNLTNVEVSTKGLWRESSLQTLNLINDEPLQAMTHSAEWVGADQIQFETLTLASFLSEHNLTQIDLLKSDCEGAEYDFMLTSSADTLQAIQRIIMEYHDLDLDQNHHKLVEFLTVKGYKVRITPNQVHPEIGYLYAERGAEE
ncbi:MAG: FkbM family methyltransferase [Anaerolineaceae bacterium]